MIEAGEDPRFIARRLIILASEDIGMAAPSVLQTVVAAAEAVAMIGMPEGRITLAHATIAAAMAPKSNAVVKAISAAQADVQAGKIGTVPPHLRDSHYAGAKGLGHGAGYKYAHDHPHGVAAQQYLPDELKWRPLLRAHRPRQRGGHGRATGRPGRPAGGVSVPVRRLSGLAGSRPHRGLGYPAEGDQPGGSPGPARLPGGPARPGLCGLPVQMLLSELDDRKRVRQRQHIVTLIGDLTGIESVLEYEYRRDVERADCRPARRRRGAVPADVSALLVAASNSIRVGWRPYLSTQ
ncbi:MAG: hypothetical protein QM804_16405 [Propionicimonas sp.]